MPSTITLENKIGDKITWADAVGTWNENEGTWDNPETGATLEGKNSVTQTLETKNSALTATLENKL